MSVIRSRAVSLSSSPAVAVAGPAAGASTRQASAARESAARALRAQAGRLLAEEASPAVGRPHESRLDVDIAQLNLAFLQVARELSRSGRELAVTRLGLDAQACAALERLSVRDLHTLAHSHQLIFSLRVNASELSAHADLARCDPVASEARLLLAANPA